jgi:hypothetical protein
LVFLRQLDQDIAQAQRRFKPPEASFVGFLARHLRKAYKVEQEKMA